MTNNFSDGPGPSATAKIGQPVHRRTVLGGAFTGVAVGLNAVPSFAGSAQETGIFATRGALAAATIPTPVVLAQTEGYGTCGDGGAASYRRSSVEPGHPGKVRSADGAWWELAPGRAIDARQLGVEAGRDCTAGIEALVEVACATRCGIAFPPGEFLMTRPFVPGTNVRGVRGATTIRFTTGFTNSATVDSRRYHHVYNRNYAKSYDPATADCIEISGIEFVVDHAGTGLPVIVGLANTNGTSVRDCTIRSTGGASARTCISLYHANKGTRIHDNVLINDTTATAGGCLWIQGGSGTATDDSSASEDIKAFRNRMHCLRTSPADEPVAIWGAGGIVRDVEVHDNCIEVAGVGYGLTVFTTANEAAVFTRATDICVRNNHIKGNVQFAGIRVGGSLLPDSVQRVLVRDNTIEISVADTDSSSAYGIRWISGPDVRFVGNTVRNVGSADISRGIGASPRGECDVENNIVRGNFSVGIQNARRVVGNVVDADGSGIMDCRIVENNRVTAGLTVYAAGEADNFVARGNTFNAHPDRTGQTIYCSDGANVDFIDNTVNCNNAGARSFLFQGTGRRKLLNNRIVGTGRVVNGAVAYAQGNWWFDRDDDQHHASAIGTDFTTHYPLGHVIRNSNPTIDANNMIIFGWQLLENAGARDWAPLYVSLVTPAE